jgi:hypothetical protein
MRFTKRTRRGRPSGDNSGTNNGLGRFAGSRLARVGAGDNRHAPRPLAERAMGVNDPKRWAGPGEQYGRVSGANARPMRQAIDAEYCR